MIRVPAGGARRFAAIFEQHPGVTTVVHVHTPYLARSRKRTGRFPIRYVAAQRHIVVTELPVYIDRRQAEVDFILEQLARDADIPAIVEANGGRHRVGPRRSAGHRWSSSSSSKKARSSRPWPRPSAARGVRPRRARRAVGDAPD